MTQTTIIVSDRAELIEALSEADGGETILLASGNYGNLSLIDNKTCDLTYSSTVTIAAADTDNPPVVTGLDVRGASNLSFDGITFDYTQEDGQQIWYKPFKASSCDNISFTNCTFDGDLASGLTDVDNGYPTGVGLNVRDSAGVTVSDCEVSGFYRGLVISNSDDVLVAHNDLHTIRMDGMNFSAVQGVVIEDNYIHDFSRSLDSADHADMIQFWTANTTRPSTDIVIRDNVLDIGGGDYTQSIFMRNDLVDRGLAGTEMYYSNVVIEGNTIINGQAHGITVGETDGLTISDNVVLHSDGAAVDGVDATVEIPRISVASDSTDVTITDNTTSLIVGDTGQDDWHISSNTFVQDQDSTADGYYESASSLLNLANALFAAEPVATEAPTFVALNADGSFAITTDAGTTTTEAASSLDADGGIQLGALGITAEVDRSDLSPLFSDDSLAISFTIDADTAGTTGEIFRLSGSVVASVNLKGELVVRAWSSEGDAVVLRSTGISVNDLASHDVEITLNDGQLALSVDGESLSQADFSGTFANTDIGTHDLTFGNPWHDHFFEGDLTTFSIALDPAISSTDPFTSLIATNDQPLV